VYAISTDYLRDKVKCQGLLKDWQRTVAAVRPTGDAEKDAGPDMILLRAARLRALLGQTARALASVALAADTRFT
jgi:hypothetical protein